jgi:hypothetical protein
MDLLDEDELGSLLADQDEANTKRGFLGVAGNVLQGVADAPSGYEIYTKTKSSRPDLKGMFGTVASGIQDPMSQQEKAYAFLKAKRENKLMGDEDSETAQLKLPESRQSKALKALAPRWGIEVGPDTTGYDIKQMIDPKKMMETEARSAVDFERQKALRAMDNAASLEKFKAEQATRLTDKKDMRKIVEGDRREREALERSTPFGLANNADDAKKLKEAYESKQNFDRKIGEMIQLRTDHNGGDVFDREAISRGKQLSKDLLLEYKNMAKLGVLSAADEKIINAIIPADPLEFNSPLAAIQGQDPIMNNLKKFKADSDADFKTRIETRVRGGQSPLIDPAGGQKTRQQLAVEELARREAAKKSAGK